MSPRWIFLTTFLLFSRAGWSASPIFYFNTVPRSDPQYQLPVTPSALEFPVSRHMWFGSKNDFHRYRIHRASDTAWTLHLMQVGSDISAAASPRYRVVFESAWHESLAHKIMAIEPPVLTEIIILSDLIENDHAVPVVVQGNHLILVNKNWKYLWLGAVLKYSQTLLTQETSPEAALVNAWNDLVRAASAPQPVRYERCGPEIDGVLRENPSAGPVELDEGY